MMGGQLTDWQCPRFAALLESDYDYTRPRRGQVRQAVGLSVREDEVIVDLGGVVSCLACGASHERLPRWVQRRRHPVIGCRTWRYRGAQQSEAE
jgi:hypothetical protein